MRATHATACTVVLLGLIEVAGMFLAPEPVELPDLGVQDKSSLALYRLPPPPPVPPATEGAGGHTAHAAPPEQKDDAETTLQPVGRTMQLWVDAALSAADLSAFLRRTGSMIGLVERQVGHDGVIRMRGGVPPDVTTGLPSEGFVLGREVERYLADVRDRHRVHIDLMGAGASPALRTLVGSAMRARPLATALLTLGPRVSAEVWGKVEDGGHESQLRLRLGSSGVEWEVRSGSAKAAK